MSQEPEPRRSQRDRKKVDKFISVGNKRKHSDIAPDTHVDAFESDEDSHDGDTDDEPQAYQALSKAPRKSKAASRGASTPSLKKPRISKSTAKPAKDSAVKPKRGRSKKTKSGEEPAAPDQATVESKLTMDNPLFNAIMNPASALQSTVEDFLESLDQTPGPAQAELINMFLRSCGCNDSVDGDTVVDYDGVVDALDNFTEALKQDDAPIYPLTARAAIFKKFRKSLSEFLERLIVSAAELGSLYSTDLMTTLQTWVVAMSSSQVRSFRHTATAIALEVETALCEVAAAVEKEAVLIGRQREGERKRKANNKGAVKDKDLEAKDKEIRGRRKALGEYLKEFIDGVFVHRFRDADPNIRAECVHSLGLWFKKYPSHFLDGTYLRYIGWVLSDNDTQVRHEAVNALSCVYAQVDYLSSLNHFTERFKPRMLEMAKGDTDISIRVAMVKVLSAIDSQSMLEDEEREQLCLLVFDQETKVRRAVAGFLQSIWSDAVDERLVGAKASGKDKQRIGIKALGTVLVRLGKALDKIVRGDAAAEDDDDDNPEDGPSGSGLGGLRDGQAYRLPSAVSAGLQDRISHAVEALWEQFEPVSDWTTLLDVLQLDHSAYGDAEAGSQATTVNAIWRLTDAEEDVLLEVLVATLRRSTSQSVASSKKTDDDAATSTITRALIQALPRLFVKYQTDSNRITYVLSIPPLMNLELYLDMRMTTAYASLWDDINKQFLSHSSTTVIMQAVTAIQHLMGTSSLSNTNNKKMVELEDELATALRDAVVSKNEIEVATFTEDEAITLSAICYRVATLTATRQMTTWAENEERGGQTSIWDIMFALMERGRMGYKEEAFMVCRTIEFLSVHIMRKAAHLLSASDIEEATREFFSSRRASLLEKLVEYAVGTSSNTVEDVKRTAFENFLNLHIIFHYSDIKDVLPEKAALGLSLDDEEQYRCTGFIQAQIERYAEDLGSTSDTPEVSDEESDASEPEEGAAKKAKGKAKAGVLTRQLASQSDLERAYLFNTLMSTFIRAIQTGTIHLRHSNVMLAHYGRLDRIFDACTLSIVKILRSVQMMREQGELIVEVVCRALQESFVLVLENTVKTEDHAAELAKHLSSCFQIRGAHLAVLHRLDSEFIVQIHTILLNWIGKRIIAYEKNKNKKGLKVAASFFRVLRNLLVAIDNHDALNIKAQMDQMLAQAKVEIAPTSKLWEPQRAYEKKLLSLMGKGPKSKKSKAEVGITDGEETGNETTPDDDAIESEPEVDPEPEPESLRRPRPKAVQSVREAAAPLSAAEPSPSEDADLADADMHADTTPKAKTRTRTIYGSESPALRSDSLSRAATEERSEPRSSPPPEDDEEKDHESETPETPLGSRKRSLTEVDPDDNQDDASAPSHEPSPVPPSPARDVIIRRKRVRR